MNPIRRPRRTGTEIYPMPRPVAVRHVLVDALANTMPSGLFVETITRLMPALAPHLRHDPLMRPVEQVNIGEHLTTRDIEILALAADGRTNAEIGAMIHYTEETVKRHLRRILGTLGVTSRTAAVAIAIRRGLIP